MEEKDLYGQAFRLAQACSVITDMFPISPDRVAGALSSRAAKQYGAAVVENDDDGVQQALTDSFAAFLIERGKV